MSRNPFADAQKPQHNKPSRINDINYIVTIRGYGPTVQAEINVPDQYAGLAKVRLVSVYLGSGGGYYEIRLDWGGVGPYQTDVWDTSLTSTPNALTNTLLLNDATNGYFGNAPSCTRILPVGPSRATLQFWDNVTGNIATFASSAYVAVQLEVTPVANKNDTN